MKTCKIALKIINPNHKEKLMVHINKKNLYFKLNEKKK